MRRSPDTKQGKPQREPLVYFKNIIERALSPQERRNVSPQVVAHRQPCRPRQPRTKAPSSPSFRRRYLAGKRGPNFSHLRTAACGAPYINPICCLMTPRSTNPKRTRWESLVRRGCNERLALSKRIAHDGHATLGQGKACLEFRWQSEARPRATRFLASFLGKQLLR